MTLAEPVYAAPSVQERQRAYDDVSLWAAVVGELIWDAYGYDPDEVWCPLRCYYCEVSWAGAGECWCCGGGGHGSA